MNNQQSPAPLYAAGAALIIGLLFWSGIFRLLLPGPPSPGIRSSYTDKLSGEHVTTQQINNVTHTNPRAPYFIAFDKFSYYNVPPDDLRYIQDFIINYTLYTKNLDSPIVSLVDGSFRGPFVESEGYVQQYGFKFGIDGADIHAVQVTSDTRGPTIDIKILVGTKVVAHKKFQVYYY